MDRNNNNLTRDFLFYLNNFLGIFGYWLLAIIETICPFMTKRKSVKDEIILITGAGSGLGQLMSVEFAELGAKIVAFDINEDGLKKTKSLVEATGSKCFTYNVDISVKENIYNAAQRVKNEVGAVYMLINNAGIVGGKNFLEISDEQIERTMNVNAMSHIWAAKAFLPDMIERNHGHIVSIASLAGLVGVNKLTDYCASKFTAVGFEESLRLELFALGYDNVHSTIVCPWYINTGMFDGVKATLPLLDPKWACERIVDAVLRNQMFLIIPRFFYFMIFLKSILPTWSGKCLVSILGADKSMDEFVGHAKRK